jgi:predicted PurR-regulated permease PerM
MKADARPPSDVAAEVARSEHRALRFAAWVALAAILWLTSPVGMGVLLGVLFAVTFRPVHQRLVRRRHPAAAALATVLGSTLAVALTFGGIAWILVRDGIDIGRKLIDSLGPGGGGRRILAAVSQVTSKVGVSAEEMQDRARSLAKVGVSTAAVVLQDVASATASIALTFFFLMLTMYFVLRRWERVVAAAQEILPLRPDYTLELFEEFRRVGQTTLLGTVVVGLLQGVLATIGYAVVRLPWPLFFGALTAIASLVPGVGTLLVWVPASAVLLYLGHAAAGVGLLVYGVVVLTAIPTYVILPRLVGGSSRVPALFTFVALFGGTAVLGLEGLVIGPVLMTVAVATLRLYAAEARARHGAPPEASHEAAQNA